MCWGAISWYGRVSLAFTTSKMDSLEYQDVLKNNLLPFFRRHKHRKLTYQQDNATIHSSRSTIAYLASEKIDVMKWPACSPDANIIENVWGILVRRVYANGQQYATTNDLKAAIIKEWEKLDTGLIRKLYDSMPNRIFDIISKNGAQIQY